MSASLTSLTSSGNRAVAQRQCSRPITGRREVRFLPARFTAKLSAAKVLVVALRSATPEAWVRLPLAASRRAPGVVVCIPDCDSGGSGSIPERHMQFPRCSSFEGQSAVLNTRRISFDPRGWHRASSSNGKTPCSHHGNAGSIPAGSKFARGLEPPRYGSGAGPAPLRPARGIRALASEAGRTTFESSAGHHFSFLLHRSLG